MTSRTHAQAIAAAESYEPTPLDARQVALAHAEGAEWGRQEVEAWMDAHQTEDGDDPDFSDAPDWTRGTYCGDLDGYNDHEAAEAIIDQAAEAVWNAARNA